MPITAPIGLTLKVNNGPGAVYQDIGQITMCSGIGGASFAQIKATWQSSTFADRVPGLPTNSPMTADFLFSRATYTQLRAIAGVDGFTFKAANRGGDTWTLGGWVTDVPGMDNGDVESTDPENIKGVKFFIRSVSFAAGTGTEGGPPPGA